MRLVRAPLRVSLVGGGSDLPSHYEKYGGGVVSFTINKYIYIAAKPASPLFPHKFRLVYSKVEECDKPEEIKHPIIKLLVDSNNLSNLDLDVMSDIPAGTGLGSSSAFTVGLNLALNGDKDKHFQADLACIAEINDLKEPIGKQDQYAASFGGLNYLSFFKDRVSVEPIMLTSPNSDTLLRCLTLVYIGGNRSASRMLEEQSKKDNSDALRRIADLAWYAKKSLQKGDIDDLGDIIHEGWEIKKTLSPNISNGHDQHIIDTAMFHGATGGKLLGAGGAGFVLLFCPINSRDKMLSGLSNLNLNYVPFRFDNEGCKVLYED